VQVCTARSLQGRAFPSRLQGATNWSTLQAVFTILAADPPNNGLLTPSHLVLHNQNPNVNTRRCTETSQIAGLTVGHGLSTTSKRSETPVPFTKRFFRSQGGLGPRITGFGSSFSSHQTLRDRSLVTPAVTVLRLEPQCSGCSSGDLRQSQRLKTQQLGRCHGSSGEHTTGAGQSRRSTRSPPAYTTDGSPGATLPRAERHLSSVNTSLLCKPVS